MIGRKTIQFHEINSTNTYIKSHYKEFESGTVVQAFHQTNGYGRIERVWHDEVGKNLMFSIYLKLPVKEDITMLTQMAASSVHKTLKDYNIPSKIKWPNDILVTEKKICGILLESIIEGKTAHIIIGIGLNVNNNSFQTEIENIATSMSLYSGKEYDLDQVLQTLLKHLNEDFDSYINQTHNYIEICRENSFLLGKQVTLFETNEQATVIDIDAYGRLVVKINDKIETFYGSEVVLPNLYQTKE